jgi:hypothetical protein
VGYWMKIILKPRQTGRTEELIRMCVEAEARGEVSYIVCFDQPEARRIFQRAIDLGFNMGFPITFDEFLNQEYAARNIRNFYIDNADHLLQRLSHVTIQAITMEESDGG